jgi:hypothetical protein
MTDLEEAFAKVAAEFGGAHRFEAKLDRYVRCQLLALRRRSFFRVSALAGYFGVSKRTVYDIGRTNSKSYRELRQEYEERGQAGFERKYLTTELIEAVTKYQRDMVVQEADRHVPSGPAHSYNPKSATKAGNRTLQDISDELVTIVIRNTEFMPDIETERGAGWYYRYLSGTMVDTEWWYGPFYTSAFAYEAARQLKQQQEDLE